MLDNIIHSRQACLKLQDSSCLSCSARCSSGEAHGNRTALRVSRYWKKLSTNAHHTYTHQHQSRTDNRSDPHQHTHTYSFSLSRSQLILPPKAQLFKRSELWNGRRESCAGNYTLPNCRTPSLVSIRVNWKHVFIQRSYSLCSCRRLF